MAPCKVHAKKGNPTSGNCVKKLLRSKHAKKYTTTNIYALHGEEY